MQFPRRFWRDWRFWPVCVLFLGFAGFVLRFPIVALDFDIWYHLLGGSYILTHHALPPGPFFSYLPDADRWVDYYWLFQVMVELGYRLGGYVSLIALRSVLYLATVWLVYRFLREGEPADATGGFVLAMVATCAYALAILPRDLILRPHIITYLCLTLFQYVVNRRPGLGWWLPVAALFWTNMHGVEYPVLLLVGGAYLADYFFAKWLHRPVPEGLQRVRWPLIVSLYAVLATPAGVGLLAKPFSPPLFHELIVNELNPQDLGGFLSFSLYPGGNFVDAASHGLVLFMAAAICLLAWKRRLRWSRVVLFLGGAILLPQSRRFTYEFLLLCLPLVSDVLGLAAERRPRGIGWKPALVASLGVVGVTLWSLSLFMGVGMRYPLDKARLPVGVCDFLLREGSGGRILNIPNPGGYLEWRLYPKYKIFMDMQTMLFSSFDLFVSLNSFRDERVLQSTLDKYHPEFILSAVQDAVFPKKIASQGNYVLVFFDDVLALYVDARKFPQLAARYRLDTLEPATCITADYEGMDDLRREKALVECRRLLDIYPDGLMANTVAAKILLARGRTDEAMVHARRLMRCFPDRYMGFALAGLAAFKDARYAAALDYNKEALRRAMPAEQPMVLRNLYATYARLKEFDKAYSTLASLLNPIAPPTPFQDLYDLGMAGVASGRMREGRLLLRMALAKAPASARDKAHEIETLLDMMQGKGPADRSGAAAIGASR